MLEVCKGGLRYQQELQVGKWDLSAIDIRHQINLKRGNEAVPSQAAGLNMPRSVTDRCVLPFHMHQGDPTHSACQSSHSWINVPSWERSAKPHSNKQTHHQNQRPWAPLTETSQAGLSCSKERGNSIPPQKPCWFLWKWASQYSYQLGG